MNRASHEAQGLASSRTALRAFGHAGDLDLDFGQPDRPGLVTALLTQCGEHRDAAFWWSQPVGARIAALLELVARTERRDDIALNARCGAAGCEERFAFDLPLSSLPPSPAADGPLRIQRNGKPTLTMRCATGDDLRRWHDAHPVSRSDALRLMLDSLVLTGEVEAGDEETVSSSIGAADPLVDFTATCRCPVCGAPNEVAIDLEALALERLAIRQRALLEEVHRLASHYGWTESEVLAVPPARRARYVALIEDQR
jgi:hypothetical protein